MRHVSTHVAPHEAPASIGDVCRRARRVPPAEVNHAMAEHAVRPTVCRPRTRAPLHIIRAPRLAPVPRLVERVTQEDVDANARRHPTEEELAEMLGRTNVPFFPMCIL